LPRAFGLNVVHASIGLIYVEGEVRGGRITGRVVLVIETNQEIDPTSPRYSSVEIARVTKLGRERWEEHHGPIDLVRLERQPEPALKGDEPWDIGTPRSPWKIAG